MTAGRSEPLPVDLLEPWTPGPEEPWDRRRAGHLLRRSGFGAAPAAVDRAVREGLPRTLDRIFHPDATGEEHDALRAVAPKVAALDDRRKLAAWWLQVMSVTPDPLREKCALIWHGHFATSNRKVRRPRLLFRQYERLHARGMGDLRTLAREMVRDEALLIFLDAETNRRQRPNENLGRELLELFLLGIGSYTEHDIREVSRALTGLRVRHDRTELVEAFHDAGEKELFGRRGRFGPEEVVDICFEQPAAARHFAARLVHAFVTPTLPEELLDELAKRLRDLDHSVERFLRWLFGTRYFFHPGNHRCRLKNPVEYVVGTLRALEIRDDGIRLEEAVAEMGQRLFEPPGVQGWTGGRAWITSARLVARNRFASRIARDQRAQRGFRRESEGRADPVGAAVDTFLDGELEPVVREQLASAGGDSEALLHLVLTLPEYQLD